MCHVRMPNTALPLCLGDSKTAQATGSSSGACSAGASRASFGGGAGASASAIPCPNSRRSDSLLTLNKKNGKCMCMCRYIYTYIYIYIYIMYVYAVCPSSHQTGHEMDGPPQCTAQLACASAALFSFPAPGASASLGHEALAPSQPLLGSNSSQASL